MNVDIPIIKASGQQVMFSTAKLRKSLQKAGANHNQIEEVIEGVSSKLFHGITTKNIYKAAFNILKNSSRNLAAKYHLKTAIMELGPSGYPFEKFIGEIFKHQGYSTKVSIIVQGKCVQHEVDVIARISNTQLMIECKYHNQQGIICDVKIPLYIHSRFKDVEAKWIENAAKGDKSTYHGCVVTNTRFSNDAIQYGNCAGLKLLGWDYPAKGSLREQIDKLGLYPITCLTSLTRNEKQFLLNKNIVLCLELRDHPHLLTDAGLKSTRLDVAVQEILQLCRHINTVK